MESLKAIGELEICVPRCMHPLGEWARSFLALTGVGAVEVILPAVGGGSVKVRFDERRRSG